MWFQKTSTKIPEADQALQDAKKTLKQVKERHPEVRAISEASREFRRKNHFAEGFQALFEGGGIR